MSRRGNPAVTWTSRRGVTRAALAIPCPTCNATIGQECNTAGGVAFTLPHRFRDEMASEFGFRDVAAPGPLFAQRQPEPHVPCPPEDECSDPGSQYCRCARMRP